MDVQCLIVDDEAELAQMTCEYFEMFGVSCRYVKSAQECLAFLHENTVKLILLDINLVEESGFALCKKIRENSNIPILFISARDSDSDVLIALNIGGDDYIKKPYSLSVLLAKVQVVLKRMDAGRQELSAGSTGAGGVPVEEAGSRLRLAEEKLCVSIKKSAVGAGSAAVWQEIPLKAKEFALLKCLYEHRGTIVTKEQLFLTVWGDAFYSDSTLNVHIRRLREKLEERPSEPRLIKTVWGTGYLLEC
ncbi:MAG: response regulator transcription factor [Clostridium sp.]|nr:response regulator transcription factor [Clostridium sp.]